MRSLVLSITCIVALLGAAGALVGCGSDSGASSADPDLGNAADQGGDTTAATTDAAGTATTADGGALDDTGGAADTAPGDLGPDSGPAPQDAPPADLSTSDLAATDVSAGDVAADVATQPDVPVSADTVPAPDAVSDAQGHQADLTLSLQTEGGFAGKGTTDIEVANGKMTTSSPFGTPQICTADLSEAQLDFLLTAASAVDWKGLASSYKLPANPNCCCDQFVYALSASYTSADALTTSAKTDWCDDSLMNGNIPKPFKDFLSVLGQVAADVKATCGK